MDCHDTTDQLVQGGDVYATDHREGRLASLGPRMTSLGGRPDWERQVPEREQSGGHGGNLSRIPVVGGAWFSDNRRH